MPRSRYRVPDLLLCGLPIPSGRVVDTLPWAVIEILSPDDRMRSNWSAFASTPERGVPQIVLLDPDQHVAHHFDNGSLLQTEFIDLPLPGGMRAPFATAELFRQLQEELAEQ